MAKPLLCAIIFTYNHKNSIARCIESLVNQNTTYPYEIRIYDDCSTDGTSDVCREYAKKYPDKIRLTIQEENTFLKPYNKTQSYKAIQEIDTKYFCIIDGDDCWCDENKVQIALDFLENNQNYIGFAHDTKHINVFTGKECSYVHDIGGWQDIKNPVELSATPYFLTSSRVFRNLGFKGKHIWPVDYLIYFYHAQKGPIYYYDKIMANYYISEYNNFSNMQAGEQSFLLSTFGYKIAKFFDFKEDKLATDVQKYYNIKGNVKHYKVLEKCKKIFGVKLGWQLWYLTTFVPVYGFECLSLNWVCPRRKIKYRADNREWQVLREIKNTKSLVRNKVALLHVFELFLKFSFLKNTKIYVLIKESCERKKKKISENEVIVFRTKRKYIETRKKTKNIGKHK